MSITLHGRGPFTKANWGQLPARFRECFQPRPCGTFMRFGGTQHFRWDFNFLPTNGFSSKPLKVKLLAQKATE